MSDIIQQTLTVETSREELETIQDVLEMAMAAGHFDADSILQAALAAEEVFVNICNYAEVESAEVDITVDEDGARIVFIDEGKEYNPLTIPDPDVEASGHERTPGGLGIFMVKNLVNTLDYRRDGNRNILTMTKHRG
ncbi:MAG: ATP-binding protein [Clostridia bacterium]|nr:ATP-binding protein [Clostridia bacterium]